MNIITKLFASTMPSIENMKKRERGEVARLAVVVAHVAERIDVDERADAGDDAASIVLLRSIEDASPSGIVREPARRSIHGEFARRWHVRVAKNDDDSCREQS